LYSNKFRKILIGLEVLRGVVSKGDQLELSLTDGSKKLRVEWILLFPFLLPEVFLGEPEVKFNQVCIQRARSGFPYVFNRFAGLGNLVLGFIGLKETSLSSFDVSVQGGDDVILGMVFQLQMRG